MAPQLGMGTFRIVNQTSGKKMWATSNGTSEERWAYEAPIAATSTLHFEMVNGQYLSREQFCQFLTSEGQDPANLTLRFHTIISGLDAEGNNC